MPSSVGHAVLVASFSLAAAESATQPQSKTVAFRCGDASSSASLAVYSDFTYDVSYAGTVWLGDGDVAVYRNGTYLSLSGGGLVPTGSAQPGRGEDAFGPYTSYAATLAAPQAAGTVSLTAAFKCYGGPNSSSPELIAFETVYDSGCASDCAFTGPDADWFCSDYFNTSMRPITHFPSWDAANGTYLQSGALSHIEWGGVFAWIDINYGPGLQPLVTPGTGQTAKSPQNGTGTQYMGGHMGGPVVLHESTWDGPKPRALHMTPLELFKHSMLAMVPVPVNGDGDGDEEYAWRWVFGLQGHLQSVAPGTRTTLGFFPSDDGITSAVMAAGAALLAAYNTTRIPLEQDVGSSHVATFTDNGAFLERGFWTQPALSNETAPGQTILPAAWRSVSLAKSMQLDPWMYLPQGTQHPFGYNWTLNPFVFGPEGLAPLVEQGLSFTYYISQWSKPGTVDMPPFTFLPNAVNDATRVNVTQSRAFHDMLVQRSSSSSSRGWSRVHLLRTGTGPPAGRAGAGGACVLGRKRGRVTPRRLQSPALGRTTCWPPPRLHPLTPWAGAVLVTVRAALPMRASPRLTPGWSVRDRRRAHPAMSSWPVRTARAQRTWKWRWPCEGRVGPPHGRALGPDGKLLLASPRAMA
jgi:hypothetical protein